MSEDNKAIKRHMCPACFSAEIDFELNYDEDAKEYYCKRCCYCGTEKEIESFYETYIAFKYKNAKVPYPD